MLLMMLLLLLLCNAIKVEIVIMRCIDAMILRGSRRRPRICELGRAGIRHVVEVHAAEALLIVDSHCHLRR